MAAPPVPNIASGNQVFSTDMRAFHAWEAGELSDSLNAYESTRLLSTSDTSTTSVLIGTGDKTFTVSAGKGFVAGQSVNVVSTANPANSMSGFVKSYSSTTLVVTVITITGSGTLAAWSIALGLSGGGASLGTNTFNGVQNYAQGADIASAATINLTTATGNILNVTGTVATSAVTLGVGMTRIVRATGAWPLTYNATTNNITGGVSTTLAAGDHVFYHNIGGVVYGLIIRASGQPVKAPTGTYLGTVYYTCVSQALTSISNASPAVFTSPTSRLTPQNFAPIQLTTSGTLPTGLSLATTYYVFNSAGTTFNVATSMANAIAGTAVNTSSAGSGTHTAASAPYVKATGVFGVPSFIEVDFIGGGAGSGGCTATAGTASGGGGMGGRAKRRFNASQLGASETIVIGDGGAGGANTGGTGTNGSNTTFGALITCNGGTASIGATANATRAGGAGGTATGGDFNINGMGGYPVVGTLGNAGAGGFNELGNNGALPASNTTYLPPDAPKNTGFGANGAQGAGTAQIGGQGASGIGIIREYS